MDCEALSRKMASSWEAMDGRLALLVSEMNEATPSEKVDRMASVINELVLQRRQMRDETAALMPQLVGHVLQHIQVGIISGIARSMAACAVMRGGSETSRTPAVEQKR